MCTLPSANVARTCRTMESPTIRVSRSVSQRGVKRFRVEISKAGGGGGGEVVAPWPGSRLPLLVHPRSVVSRRRSEGHLGRSRPGCTGPVQRNARSKSGGSVSSTLYTCELQLGMFPARLSALSAGPASPLGRGSASPWPPAPAAPNALKGRQIRH